nr:MAG TPA: hypothetical protein [Caudoviricetes sp.]
MPLTEAVFSTRSASLTILRKWREAPTTYTSRES